MKNPTGVPTSRLLRHAGLWAACWLFIRYINVGLYVQDTPQVLFLSALILVGQTFVLFYLFAYFMLPRYLYRVRVGPFCLAVLVVYYLVYLSNYYTSYHLHGLSQGGSRILMIQTKAGWAVFRSAGLLGCFTSPEAAFLSAGNSFLYVSVLLVGKLVKDLLTHRTRTLTLERDAIDLERANLATERDNLLLELDLLKAQVNPHFLFNALNSIYARVVDVNEPAAELVLRLAELMRYNLYEADVAQVALADEIAYIENYLSLEKMRHASLIDVIFQANDDFAHHRIAPLMLIAFVENAFKHGLGSGTASAYVLVDAQLEGDTFYFTVQNSIAQPTRTGTAKKSGGVGLPNIKKRLALLYADRYELEISQTPTRYTTTLRLQLDRLP